MKGTVAWLCQLVIWELMIVCGVALILFGAFGTSDKWEFFATVWVGLAFVAIGAVMLWKIAEKASRADRP